MRAYLDRAAPFLLLGAFGIFAYFPLLFLGMAFFGEEQIGFYYTTSYYVHESIRAGLPLTWIPSHYGGVPASLDQFVSAWYPLNRALFSVFDFFTAHHLSITIATIAGLVLTYLFGRAQGWLRSSSVILALFYFLATTYGWLQIGTTAAHSFAILPGLLLALHYAYLRKTYVFPIIFGALALGIGFLAGFMQIVFYDYAVAGLYALFLDWTRFSKSLPLYKNLPVSISYAAITGLGLIIGFLQFYPSASMIDLTIRTSTYAIQNAYIPYPSELLAFLLPPYLSVPFFGGGGSAGMYLTGIGLIGIFFALRYFRHPSVVFFSGVYAIFAAFAFHLPLFSWINEHVPPFANMGGNFRWMVGAAFPLAFVSTAGIEGYLRNPEMIPPRFMRACLWAVAILSALCIIGSLILSSITAYVAASPQILDSMILWYTSGRTLVHPASHYTTVLTQALTDLERTFSLFNPRFLFGMLLWLLAGLILAVRHYGWVSREKMSHMLLAYVIFAAAGITALQWNDFVPQSLYAEEPALNRLIKDRETDNARFRIMGFILGDGTYLQLLSSYKPTPENTTRIQMQTLVNNTNLYFDIDRMDGMEPYRTLRHNHLLNTVIAYDWAAWAFDDESPELTSSPLNQLYNRNVQKKVTVEEKLADLPKRLPLLSMMNVKYIYSPYELKDASLTPIASIPIQAGTTSNFSLHLYENQNVLPRIYVSKGVRYASTEREAFLATIRNPDFSKQTIIECTSCTDTSSGDAGISIDRYEPGSIEVTIDAKEDTWLVISESTFPGWRATIDDVETEIRVANYLFQAIRVIAGKHRVALTYQDISVRTGD